MSIKFEDIVKPSPEQWKVAIMSARNPLNSWDRYDSKIKYESSHDMSGGYFEIGPNDYDLLKRLCKAGTDHRKFMRMLPVMVTITAPLYWWKEFSTYKIGTVANSCSTMHKIHAKEFTLDDFSCEHLYSDELEFFKEIVDRLNGCRNLYLASKKGESARIQKNDWWQMIQLLPSSYNQKRTVMLNYEVLANIYKSRRAHKLDEWAEHKEIMPSIDSTSQAKYANPYKEYFGFCDWIKTLPYSELITGGE